MSKFNKSFQFPKTWYVEKNLVVYANLKSIQNGNLRYKLNFKPLTHGIIESNKVGFMLLLSLSVVFEIS